MQEVREAELSPSSSSVKPILAVAGVLCGLLLLVCGGVAGYVVATAPPPAEPKALVPPQDILEMNEKMRKQGGSRKVIPYTLDPMVVKNIAAAIVDFDLPPNFESIEGKRNATKRWVVFGKRTEDAALLKLAGVDREVMAAVASDNEIRDQMLQMAENENGRTDTGLKKPRQTTEQRELTVLGKKAVFEFKHGRRAMDNTPVCKILGVFETPTGTAALVYMLPESEFDEEAIVHMIESIRPAKDEPPDAGAPAGEPTG